MYSVIGIFEIILRNSIDRHYASVKGTSWLKDAVMPNGHLAVSPGCEDSFRSVKEALHKLGAKYTHDRLVAKLTFGFWTYQFSKKEFAAAGSTLLEIFPNRPHGISPKTVFKNLSKINETRNRIAHYEPVCFDNSTGAISTTPVQKRYDLIIEMFSWLGCMPQKILYGINGVQKMINEVASFETTAKNRVLQS